MTSPYIILLLLFVLHSIFQYVVNYIHDLMWRRKDTRLQYAYGDDELVNFLIKDIENEKSWNQN